MKVLIDLSQIPKNKVGVGVYAHNLTRQLAALDSTNQYVFLIQDDEDCLNDLVGKNIRLIRLNHRIFRRFIFRVAMEQILIPILIRIERIDVAHSLHYSFPFIHFNASLVVTIHDMTFFLYPQYHMRIKQLYFRFFINRLARWADAVIAVSESTKSDFLRITSVCSGKVKVIPLGRPVAAIRSMVKRQDPAAIFNKFKLTKPYLLYVGTLEPRKNIERLIRVFARLSETWPQGWLVIAGSKGWNYNSIFNTVRQQHLEKKVCFLGYISDTEKYCLMSEAHVFVYPSLYEGFGLPVLEAMSMGTATITSNRSSMPEVAGTAAVQINPEDELQMYNGILSLISNPKFRKKISRCCKNRSAEFRWRRTAESTLNLYKSVYEEMTRG